MVTNKQLLVEGTFEVFNRNRDRRLGNVQLTGSLSDTLRFHHRHEIFKLFEGKSVHRFTIDKILSYYERA